MKVKTFRRFNCLFSAVMSIVGLDLAGIESRPAGFCVLSKMKAKTRLVYTDAEIVEGIREVEPCLVAVDAPLCLPPGRKSIEERTSVHLRECDRELLRMGIKLFPITLGPMRKLTARGIALKETLTKMGFNVIEAYPGGAQDVLGIPRKQKGLDSLRVGLSKLGIEGLTSKMSDHELDAVTCAFVGKLLLEGRAVKHGLLGQEIVMPCDERRGSNLSK
jgi:predicted nuclease with RNAse H fold